MPQPSGEGGRLNAPSRTHRKGSTDELGPLTAYTPVGVNESQSHKDLAIAKKMAEDLNKKERVDLKIPSK